MAKPNKDRSEATSFPFSGLVFALSAVLLLAACAPSGEIEGYFERRAGWVGFIGGEDIRAACGPGAAERYRFTYNANRLVQARIYDLARQGDDGGAFRVRVLTGNQLPRDLALSDILDWLAPIDRTVRLERAAAGAIVTALDADGFTGGVPVGALYDSADYYWLVAGCRNGEFLFNAWARGDGRFEALSFPALLFAQDPIAEDVPVRAPRPVWQEPDAPDRRAGGSRDDAAGYIRFDIAIEADGVSLYRNY